MLAPDLALLAILIFEGPSLFFSQYRANSVRASEIVVIAVLVYFVTRFTIRKPLIAAWLAALIGLGGAWLSFSGIREFMAGIEQLTAVGLTDFVAFRSRFIHPIHGWVPGECFTVLLLTLPFACAAAAYLWRIGSTERRLGLAVLALLPILAIVAALFLSLSRAVFWSTILFFIIACGLMAVYRVVAIRTASLILAATLDVLLLVMVCETALYPGIYRAYAGGDTSQMRSTQGRIDIWSRSLELTRGHRLWGVGSSNAALSLLSSAEQDETTGFASRAFSLPIQVLVEKGLIGFSLYSTFLFLVGWQFHLGMRASTQQAAMTLPTSASKKRRNSTHAKIVMHDKLQAENAHRAMKCCFAAGLAAILLRELTYSSLLEHTLTLALAFILAALICAGSTPDAQRLKPIVFAVAGVALILLWPFWRFHRADAKLREYYTEVASANFTTARASIDEAIRLWPWNARYYGWRAYVDSQQLPSQCSKHSKSGNPGLSGQAKQSAQQAADDYRHALMLNGRDAVAHHNLAWLEHLLGDDAAAARNWREAVEIDPDNAAFHLSYGMFLEESGDVQASKDQYESAIELTPSILDSPFFTRYRSRSPEAANSIVYDSIATLESRLGYGDDPILEARLGKLYLYAGNIGRSRKLLDDAARQLPNLPLVWFNLGELNEARGDREQALICYQRAQAINASLAGPYLRMGQISLRNGEKDDALHDLTLAVELWQRINPITSAHNNRLYAGPMQTIDDLLPTTLVWYISPCEASEAWSGLAQLSPQNTEYAHRAGTCEQIPAPHAELE